MNYGVGGVDGSTVVGREGEEGRTEHAALQDTYVQDYSWRCEVPYPNIPWSFSKKVHNPCTEWGGKMQVEEFLNQYMGDYGVNSSSWYKLLLWSHSQDQGSFSILWSEGFCLSVSLLISLNVNIVLHWLQMVVEQKLARHGHRCSLVSSCVHTFFLYFFFIVLYMCLRSFIQ